MHLAIVEERLAGIRIVLVRPSHAGNVGAVARAMKTMGLRRLVVVAPRDPDFATAPEATAFASGADDLLAQAAVAPTLDDALGGTVLQFATASLPREFAAGPVDPDAAAALALDELDALRASGGDATAGEVAFVFGTERTGLSVAEAQRCARFTSIPTAPDADSLNLAQAVQVFAWSLRRAVLARTASAVPAAPSAAAPVAAFADHAQVEGLYAHLEAALVAIGFLDPASPKRLMPRLRRLFGRTRLQREEVDILRGICTSMQALATGSRPGTPTASHRGERRTPGD